MPHHHSRILYIDAYDSFANNIVSLIQSSCKTHVEVVKHDDARFWPDNPDYFQRYLQYFHAAVVGPGPGDPRNPNHIGIISFLWNLPSHVELPVLGVCLGLQSLCQAYGGVIEKLQEPRHGLIRPVEHNGKDIFSSTSSKIKVTCYHSLYITLSNHSTEIDPLAWDNDDQTNPYPILMAARHKTKPFWGVQYHPESICTNTEGSSIISSWWKLSTEWNSIHNREVDLFTIPKPQELKIMESFVNKSVNLAEDTIKLLLKRNLLPACDSRNVNWKSVQAPHLDPIRLCDYLRLENEQPLICLNSSGGDPRIISENLGRFSVITSISRNRNLHFRYNVATKTISFVTRCNKDDREDLITKVQVNHVWSFLNHFMESIKFQDGNRDIPFWGGFIGYITYEAGLETIDISEATFNDDNDIHFIFVERSLVYDRKTSTLCIQDLRCNSSDNDDWISKIELKLKVLFNQQTQANIIATQPNELSFKKNRVQTRQEYRSTYNSKIQRCDKSIRDGDSYEICLTDTTKIYTKLSDQDSGWRLFKKLQKTNPAPFSSYLRLSDSVNGVTIASSSPERFLKWSRNGICQFRPIKGTVKKSTGVTFEEASKILNSSKEQAENLMITDLIRHDLYGVVGSNNVECSKLMQIEEYETVYQLVSVIESHSLQNNVLFTGEKTNELSEINGLDGTNGLNGTNGLHGINGSNEFNGFNEMNGSNGMNKHKSNGVKQIQKNAKKPTGIQVLMSSLPPGSMTGAPKRRSCELISDIENKNPRGIYSGIIGYLDVGGGGDFSVVIRTAYKRDNDIRTRPSQSNSSVDDIEANVNGNVNNKSELWEQWNVGAGGAITVQSNASDEYHEMLTKLNSAMSAFNLEFVFDKDEEISDHYSKNTSNSSDKKTLSNEYWCENNPF